jgi:glycosyltransferase involved in cell wall biosynthesis
MTVPVSVLMSVYNGEKYLALAVQSILDQTFRDFEFIIVNDGSTDRSGGILAGFAASDGRILIIETSNQGLTKSLNVGLSYCHGQYVARMDADDVSLPARLEKQVEFLNGNPDYVIVGAEVMMIDSDGDPLCHRGHVRDHEMIDRECLLAHGGALTHSVIMVRKAALDQVGGYDQELETVQDLDLYSRLCEVGKAFNLSETLLLWRQHPDSINRTRYNTWSEKNAKIVGRIIRRRGLDEYLRRIFDENANSSQESFAEECLWTAKRGGNYACAFKHFRRIVSERGFRLGDARQLVILCEGLVRKSLRSFARK